jgi:hypothetical protein
MPTGRDLHVNSGQHQEFSGQELSPRRSRSSNDSDDSLRALELLDGAKSPNRSRSFSISSLGFERDLLPLSASLSEPDEVRGIIREKNIGLINGKPMCITLKPNDHGFFFSRRCLGRRFTGELNFNLVSSRAVDLFVQIGSGIL